MKIFVVNAGSSSLKYQLIDMDDQSVIVKGLCERIGQDMGDIVLKKPDGSKFEADYPMPDHTTAFKKVIEWMTSGETKVIDDLKDITAVGHRIVQGGAYFKESCLVNDDVLKRIEDYGKLAPLHNPAHVQGIRACIDVLGKDVPQVVVFDTSFHSTMPDYAYTFPLPYKYYEEYKIRRYGAHGTSHRYISDRVINECGVGTPSRVITCHLGNGSSITAVKDGKCIDTSMGLTPLDGFMMGTRCGAVDPIAFTGGLGENDDDLREFVLDSMSYVGLKYDKEKNKKMVQGNEGELTAEGSNVRSFVLLTDEEMVIAKDTKAIVEKM